jgi:hypothetical protein
MITAAKPTAAPKTRFTSLELVELGFRLAARKADPLATRA